MNFIEKVKNDIDFKINNIKKELDTDISNDKLDNSKKETLKHIEIFKKDLYKSIKFFNKNLIWDKLNIAFYGETNAGKSTIIEALRIYFREKTKINSRIRFDYDKNYCKIISDIEEKRLFWHKKIDFFETNRFLNLFLLKLLKKIIIFIFLKRLNFFEKKYQEISNAFDGGIIGDGKSDFTKKMISYDIEVKGKKFSLIDLPGIQGKENLIQDEIFKAISRAHIVFYVTANSQLPDRGTLEKIKSHLKNQAEIYTILNIKINNYKNIKNNLLDQDQQDTMIELDKKMQNFFSKDTYGGSSVLSARPVFLALANDFMPGDKSIKHKEKLLTIFSKDEVLQIANFNDFIDLITQKITVNMNFKIKKSNYKKINSLILDFSNKLKQASKKYEDLNIYFNNDLKDTDKNLNNIIESYKINSKNEIHNIVYREINNLRTEIFEYIDTNVSNSSLEEKLKNILKINKEQSSDNLTFLESLILDIDDSISIIGKNLEKDIYNELEKLDKKIEKHIEKYPINIEFDDIKIDVKKFKISNAISAGVSLISIFIGVFIGFSTAGAGLYATLCLIISGVFGLFKSLKAIFDSDYKKLNQKKSVNEILNKLKNELEKEIDNQLNKIYGQAQEEKVKIIESIRYFLDSSKRISVSLDRYFNDFLKIYYRIKQQEELL